MPKIKLIDGGKVPEYKTEGSSCADCYARLPTESVTIIKGKRVLIPLGFALELQECYEAIIRPRSGLTLKGIDVGIGTIDSDYRGEVMACVINNSDEDYVIHNLDRICQIKIQPTRQFNFEVVDELSKTERGESGFGSTGVSA